MSLRRISTKDVLGNVKIPDPEYSIIFHPELTVAIFFSQIDGVSVKIFFRVFARQ
jgi:hypothetical protein